MNLLEVAEVLDKWAHLLKCELLHKAAAECRRVWGEAKEWRANSKDDFVPSEGCLNNAERAAMCQTLAECATAILGEETGE